MSRWIQALPCISFSVKERKIARKYGFLTYPEFLDNFYIAQEGRPNIPKFMRHLVKNRSLVIIAVYPDNSQFLGNFHKNYDFCEWLYPLHRKEELDFVLKHDFDWVGMPHVPARRDYSPAWFIEECDKYGLKKWYLGFWNESKPWILHHFDGFDTTLPETYSGKYGKKWLSWNTAVKPTPSMKTIELFENNVRQLRMKIDELSFTHRPLVAYLGSEGGEHASPPRKATRPRRLIDRE